MITLQKHFSHLVAVLTAVALAGSVKGDQANESADSTASNLRLAPTESTAAMKDVPAPTTERAKPAPEKKALQPAPKPAAPVVPKTLTAAAGTRVPLAASESISTRQAKPGDAFSATVGQDVKDASGHVVIPAGSAGQGAVVAAQPAPNPRSTRPLGRGLDNLTLRGASHSLGAARGAQRNGEAG